jgi:hypothetical protein
MSEMREELERLRRDVDQLLARLPAATAPEPTTPSATGTANNALVRHLKEQLAAEGKTRGIVIARVVIIMNDGHTSMSSGVITSSNPEDFRKPTQVRESTAAMVTNPIAIRAARELAARFLEGGSGSMTKAELAATLSTSESDVEAALRPLVADEMLRWSKSAAGEEIYELGMQEPHALLIQSL